MARRNDARGLRVCWVDTMRYTQPLGRSQARKWQRLCDDLGVEIYVTSFAPGLRPQCFVEHARFTQWPALPFAPLRWLSAWLLAPPLTLWLILTRGVEVLVAHDPYIGGAAALTRGLARLCGRRVALVIETRGELDKGLFGQRHMPLAAFWRLVMRHVARYSVRRADALRTISASTSRQARAIDGEKPLLSFMSWTDSEAFAQVVPTRPVSQRNEILFAGALIPRKGVHHLLEAFTRVRDELPEARLRLVGAPANRDYAAGLRRQVEARGLQERVSFEAHTPQAQLARRMAAARVLVLPSESEGLGKVIIEAMLCGTPVLASAVDGIPEIVEEGVTGFLVPVGDVAALAERLRQLFRDEDVDRMGDRARAFAGSFFSPEAYVENYGRLFTLAWNEAQR